MLDLSDLLKLRVLVCFYKAAEEGCTVTGLSRTLDEEKYVVSRMLIALEKDGLIDRSNQRHPVLTDQGFRKAKCYAERLETAVNHLLYEGVDLESAKRDALYWAMYNSDQTMEVIQSMEERYRVKFAMRDRREFSGAYLCRNMKNGVYKFPFLVYREQVKNGSNISMANEGFEHPCVLQITDGIGSIQLHAVTITGISACNGLSMKGRVRTIKYLDGDDYVNAESNGPIFTIPASALHFVNVGTGTESVLHGSACIKMNCSVGVLHMPVSTAIFTIII